MTDLPKIGFIGLGEMGAPMARSLLRAGYRLVTYDKDPGQHAHIVAVGAESAISVAEVINRCDVIATSLPSSGVFVTVAEHEILPAVRAGQTMIDFGTVTPPETRRLAALFAARGVDLLDVPVSGGPGGAENARLYMFAGGDKGAVERCRPILETIGGGARLTYCGPAGSGQVVKGVNQLMMGLVDAAYLESIAFGVNSGVTIEVIRQAIGHEGRWRNDFSGVAGRIADGRGLQVGVKFRELPYFLEAARHAGFELPITQAVHDCCADGQRVTIDDHRDAPSYWHELTKSCGW